MRVLASLLVVSILLAGCTGDGNLGEIDEGAQRDQAQARASSLWENASASHRGDVRISGSRLDIAGGLAPIELATIPLRASASQPFPTQGNVAPTHFALVGASHNGTRGWLVLNASGTPAIDADAARPIVLRDLAVRTDGAGIRAHVLGSNFGPFENAPPRPNALANATESRFTGVVLPANVTVRALGLEFFGPDGASRPLGPAARVDTTNAALVALVATGGGLLLDVALQVDLVDVRSLDWGGNLTVHATPPAGEIELAKRTEILALYNEATVKLRGVGPATMSLVGEGREWMLSQADVDLVDIRTGPTPRLQASLRLAPDLIEAVGPAGNTTRVKLILVETSGGADAHLHGYRIDQDVQARYVGAEPITVTRDLLELMNETGSDPITAPMLIGIGVTLPFFAILEGSVNVFRALFPPSLAGTLAAGEGQVLTFELVMPEIATDVEILIEAANADPVRATIKMQPVK